MESPVSVFFGVAETLKTFKDYEVGEGLVEAS
ncbi:MAG: hypothetical protein ACI8RZ_007847, partial [Myxococcota bacterium]